ncbi:MAG: S41 family peptidase [Tannerellaceae bacterium]|jgi:carboxyl-terminal processing protease|nr:S41 family peptidase [Tannerellaceae bacterium]
MRNRISPLFAALFSLLLAGQANAQNQQMNMEQRKLSIALYAIANLYVDSTNTNKLVEDAITGMLEKLDPHSEYSDAEATRELNEPLQGNFDGIGIQFNMATDTVYIVQVITGGPSEKAGLIAGDRIILINDSIVAGIKMKSTDIQKRLRGPRGTIVKVKIQRHGEPEFREFAITRGEIPVYSLDATYMIDKNTGYIKLNRFAAKSLDEIKNSLGKLKKEGMKNLILDLQGNGGGYMGVAVELADEFLSKDKLIVYSEGFNQPRETAASTAKGNFETGRLVVMVDELSASSSEILAGAVQDWDRAVIVGRRTFGKGLVQKPIPLPDKSMIRLTVARYYTPSGRCIQKNYEKGDKTAYQHELYERYLKGEMMNADSIQFPDSMKFNTLASKRTVYGGGGIMPDVFIPLDTTRYSNYHRRLVSSGIINRVAMNYVDINRTELKHKYPDINTFRKYFTSLPIDEMKNMAEAEKIPFSEDEFNLSADLISLQIKALIARDLFDTSEYYQIMNASNESFQAAVRIINDEQEYNKILKP